MIVLEQKIPPKIGALLRIKNEVNLASFFTKSMHYPLITTRVLSKNTIKSEKEII